MSIKDLLKQLIEQYTEMLDRHQALLDKDGPKVSHKVEFFSGVKPSKDLSPQIIITKAPTAAEDTTAQDHCWAVEIFFDGIPLIKEYATTIAGDSLKNLEPILIGRLFNVIFAAGMGNLISIKRQQN